MDFTRHCEVCAKEPVIEASPIGGGFVRHVPLKHIVARNVTLPEELVKTRVGFDEPEWGVYDAYIDPVRRWNGWLIPLMTLDAVREFGAKQARLVDEDEGFEDWVEVSEDGIVTSHHKVAFEDESYQITPVVIDGMTLYNMGLGLCWQEYPEEVTV